MSIILHGTNGITYPDGVVQAEAAGDGALLGISSELLTNTRITDSTDVTVSTTAATIGSATAAQTLAAGDIIALWIIEHAMVAASSSIQYNFGILVNSVDYFFENKNLAGTKGNLVTDTTVAEFRGGLHPTFSYTGNSNIMGGYHPILFLFDVDGLGIATGSQAITARIIEVSTSVGGTLRGSTSFDTRIAWAILKGT